MNEKEKLHLCSGCRDNFYNAGNNDIGVKRCWRFKDARVVTRYRLGWWTQPTSPQAFTKVTTLNCHYATGQYVMLEKLPADIEPRENEVPRG